MKFAIKNLFLIICLCFSFGYAREDLRTYYSDIEQAAVWIKPKGIKVYVTPDKTKYNILLKAFKTWDEALGGDLNFVYVKNPQEADITIKYVENLPDNQAGVSKTLHTKIQGRIYLSRVDISVARRSPSGFLFSDLNLNRIALHEIGHALGILGHSDNDDDIMFFSTASRRANVLSNQDISTVKKIYGF